MAVEMEQTVDEIRRLQGCLNDLVSVLALPAIWSGHESSQIVRTLLDVLFGMLRLDFAYVRVNEAIHGAPIEMLRSAQHRQMAVPPQEVGRVLNRWLTDSPLTSPVVVPNPLGAGEVSLVSLRLGLQEEFQLGHNLIVSVTPSLELTDNDGRMPADNSSVPAA